MKDPEILAEVSQWVRYAAEDLRLAESLIGDPDASPRHVCYNAQQAAEKALKAALIYEQIEFPFTHDLDTLRNLLPDSWTVKGIQRNLRELTEWATESRYPGDWPVATDGEAVSAANLARAVHDAVVQDLEARGWAPTDAEEH